MACALLTFVASNQVAQGMQQYSQQRESFLDWCRSEVPQGSPVADPPPSPQSQSWYEAEAAANPSWTP